jgi:anti-sigma regulatory factor (Ser/Thr protein kinase)
MAEREHLVAAYDDPAALVARVAGFVAESLEDGVPVVTISRPAHRRAVDDVLAGLGVDPVGTKRDGTLVTLDADETMSLFMVEGCPDPDRFAGVVASLVPTGGGPVSAFGEMVALLWERGEVAAALELESLWNTAIVAHPIRLLCAYPGELLADSRLSDVARACDLHDQVSLIGAHPGSGEVPPCSDEARSSIHLPVPAAVSSVRHFVRDALTAWDLHDLVGDVTLVTSELATNAITHGGSPFRTSLSRVDGVVRVAVEDRSRAWPERHHARPGDQDGRGMAIVATLSQRSGCEATPGGKVAWAELDI